MKYLILLIFSFLLIACSSGKEVYWCGDHACINMKEKETYFKKTMIVEIKKLGKQDKKIKSDFEVIKEHAGLEKETKVKDGKELTKQARLEEKRRIKEEKELAKQIRLDEKRRIKEEKKLAKQIRLEEKRRINEEKKLAKQVRLEEKRKTKSIWKEEKKSSKKKVLKTQTKEIVINIGTATINVPSAEFNKLVEKITKKNMLRSFPNINDIPN